MRKDQIFFLIIAISALVFCTTVRIVENDWYNNIEGQCGVLNKNPTCEGWQGSAIIASFFIAMCSIALFFVSRGYEIEDANSIKEVKKE
jgi:hypothetical protein